MERKVTFSDDVVIIHILEDETERREQHDNSNQYDENLGRIFYAAASVTTFVCFILLSVKLYK